MKIFHICKTSIKILFWSDNILIFELLIREKNSLFVWIAECYRQYQNISLNQFFRNVFFHPQYEGLEETILKKYGHWLYVFF